MKDKNRPDPADHWDSWSQATYQIGSTNPPKSHGGIIAFLLVLVIFLCGITTVLGLMNIRLFQALSAMESTQPYSVVFSSDDNEELPENAVTFPLGFSGQEVSSFWQTYHDLPSGIYVVEVVEDLPSRNHGLLPGDILTCVENIPIDSTQAFLDVLDTFQPGEAVDVCIYRNGTEHDLILTMEED